MVVRIIKGGVNPAERIHEAGCVNCGCIFSFATSDAKYNHKMDGRGFFSIPCPECRWPLIKDAQ